jgi:membrane protease YdiL (CAAX protease family)
MRAVFLFLSAISLFAFLAAALCQLSGGPLCAPLDDAAPYLGSAAIHLGIFSLAMYALWKKDLKASLASIGFPGSMKDGVFYGVMTLGAIFLVLFIFGMFALAFNFNDQHKVTEKISTLPPLILLLAVLGAPLTEELFFRGVLSVRYGVLPSSILFGLMHLAYGSVVEVVGAFLIGLVLAMSMRFTKSVTPCIIAHMAYNAIAITIITFYS